MYKEGATQPCSEDRRPTTNSMAVVYGNRASYGGILRYADRQKGEGRPSCAAASTRSLVVCELQEFRSIVMPHSQSTHDNSWHLC